MRNKNKDVAECILLNKNNEVLLQKRPLITKVGQVVSGVFLVGGIKKVKSQNKLFIEKLKKNQDTN